MLQRLRSGCGHRQLKDVQQVDLCLVLARCMALGDQRGFACVQLVVMQLHPPCQLSWIHLHHLQQTNKALSD